MMAPTKSTNLLLLFATTLFVSASLLFWIQPLIAKSVLPALGGTPSVWNTCLLFFQTMLLAGYVYALATSKWLGLRLQAVVHGLLILLTAIYVFRTPVIEPVVTSLHDQSPTSWLLKILLSSIGLPFFVISTSNPLLQSWFSKLRHQWSVDPYFLFAASNAGSLMALVGFPLILEPTFGLNSQYKAWRVGFLILAALTCVIALILKPLAQPAPEPLPNHSYRSTTHLSLVRRLRWIALSFVPSSLMLGVTTHITVDVAAVPLLWVIPLALYLLTFILAFSKRQLVTVSSLNRPMVVAALVVTLILSSGATEPAWGLIFANLIFFFLAALSCHSQLASDRPSVTRLAEYYLWIAVGGALGSVFNVLIAPLVFKSIIEYPLAIVFACLLLSSGSAKGLQKRYFDLLYPLGLYLMTLGLAVFATYLRARSIISLFIVLGIPLILINHFFRERPVRFGLGLAAVMLASVFYSGQTNHTLYVVRNFFGTSRVTTDSAGKINSLFSGNTVHGRQFVEQSRQCEPISYHHEHGPLGQVMAVFNAAPANHHVAVIGLGVGAMAAYSKPSQDWTFYEIDPDIIKLARESSHFTFLQKCMSGSLQIVEGDARLSLQNAPAHQYALIVFDAFSSDAIPVHLVTEQALDLYLSKLAAGGILVFHASNRSLDLRPILADLAASRKLIAIGFDDLKPISMEAIDPSEWVVMARSESEIANLSINSQWQRLSGTKDARVWSDDFSNIFRAIRWH